MVQYPLAVILYLLLWKFICYPHVYAPLCLAWERIGMERKKIGKRDTKFCLKVTKVETDCYLAEP